MNKEDERMREIFQHLKAEDERNAPSFTHDWNAALSRMNAPRRPWTAWQMSTGFAAMVILLGIGWWMFVRQSSTQVTRVETVAADTSAPNTLPPVFSPQTPEIEPPGFTSTVPKPPVSRAKSRTKKTPTITHRRSSSQSESQQQPVLISQWRSPTEYLMRIPGEQFLKSVPRLDDSVVNIKTTISNQKN